MKELVLHGAQLERPRALSAATRVGSVRPLVHKGVAKVLLAVKGEASRSFDCLINSKAAVSVTSVTQAGSQESNSAALGINHMDP